MKSESTGAAILNVEVLNVSPHGFWLLVEQKEYFLDFDYFPWFQKAALNQIFAVELHHGDHLYWPKLDVDLHLDSIKDPDKFPLVAEEGE